MEIKLYEQEEFDRLLYAYEQGHIASLQQALPLLTPKAIEFIRYGILPGEWDSND